jgi:hypothetical protein
MIIFTNHRFDLNGLDIGVVSFRNMTHLPWAVEAFTPARPARQIVKSACRRKEQL